MGEAEIILILSFALYCFWSLGVVERLARPAACPAPGQNKLRREPLALWTLSSLDLAAIVWLVSGISEWWIPALLLGSAIVSSLVVCVAVRSIWWVSSRVSSRASSVA